MNYFKLFVLIASGCKCDLILPIIDSLIQNFHKTPFVTIFTCGRQESIKALRHYSRNIVRVNVLSVTSPHPFHIFSQSSTTFILDLDCNKTANFLIRADKWKLFATPLKWFIFSKQSSDNMNLITEYFAPLHILVDSDVTLIARKYDNSYSLKKIYKRRLDDPFLEEALGEWSRYYGLNISKTFEKVTYKRRRNLKRTILNTCIVITKNDSLNHLTDKRDIHIDSITKVNYVLVEHLSDTINARLNYSVADTWGYKNNESRWSGMIGELTRKEADIGGTPLFLTSDRIDIIDYIAMTTPTRSKFIFRQPKLSYVANVFTLPFDAFVWISIWSLLALVAVIYYIAVTWEWKNQTYLSTAVKAKRKNKKDNSWLEIVFITFGALCQQGSPSVPWSVSGRITVIFFLVSFMFLYTSYSANIVALLQSSSNSIQSLGDLLHSRLDVGVDDTVFNHFYFPNATEPIRRAIYLQKVAPPGQKPRFYHIEDGIERVRRGLFAFHVETGPGYKFVGETFQEDEKCDLQGIQYLQVSDPWLAIQKNSSFKKMLKVGLRLLQENGIQAREVGLIYMKKPLCLGRSSTFISVSLVDCYPAAVVFALGLGASLVILLIEICLSKHLYRCSIREPNNKRLATFHYMP